MEDYDFFLFSKLFDLIINLKLPYDDLHPITCFYYEKFTFQDNNNDIGLYDAITNYLNDNKQAIRYEQK